MSIIYSDVVPLPVPRTWKFIIFTFESLIMARHV